MVVLIDGSYNPSSNKSFKGGVGGVFKLQDGKKILEYSGPSNVPGRKELTKYFTPNSTLSYLELLFYHNLLR